MDSNAQSFYDWREDFVIRSNNDQDHEKNGTLDFLSSNLKDVIFSLTLSHLGIFRLAPDPFGPAGDSIRHVRAELYCEQMEFNLQPP